jgi:gamma-glutamyltranspeptidase/glutathione hydrolase
LAPASEPAGPNATTPSAAGTPPAVTPPAATPAAPSATRRLPAHDPATPGVAVGVHGAVASAERHANEAALAVLRRGGNAADAAIALGFALAVTHPAAGNLGGGGFMVVRMTDGTETAIDYRETAPGASSADMFLDDQGAPTDTSLVGAKAAGIPGTVAGLARAHARFGTRPWRELVAPAIALARDGHVLDESHAAAMAGAATDMRAAGFADSARVYESPDGTPLAAGATWRQPDLARTLERIAEGGASAFYRGEFAHTMAERVQKLGGIWRAADLAGYRAIERAPVAFEYRGHRVISMPPPSGGGVVLRQMLGASEFLDAVRHPWRSAEGFHLFVEFARRAYADRNELLGDPDFSGVPTARLTSIDYVRARMGDVDPAHATPSSRIRGGQLPVESPETTHYAVVDDVGNAVANTYTLNASFGAKVVIPGTGILLNNEMDDFAVKPGAPNLYGLVQGKVNAIAPGKRMLSSMTPTIVVKDGKLRAILGTPGGSTITTTVAQILRAIVDYGRPLDEAVRAPRVHHQWLPDRVTVEPGTESAIVGGLRARGHEVVESTSGAWGHANCIEVDPATGGYRAVADVTRKAGSALAY